MKLLKLLLITVIFVFAGCTETLLDTETSNDDALKSGKNNPLTFESEFPLILESRTLPPYVTDMGLAFDQVIIGTETARHLGKTKLKVEETIHFEVYPMIGVAHVTFTAANGDELMFETTSNMTFEGHDPNTQIINIVSTGSTFVKGTGRFKKAKDGELHKVGTFNDDPEVRTGTATYSVKVTY